eukprot:CAMPEP_0194044490 /NCGR_PEP_ID=MMETSP0009_2-20130614/15948_1 /TAXON_ID=210454 /ORGANISM="Grammatophora oceanica, Strain CCMP 410" /LENGTH=194 /DNA_ID=CAMNT_0038689021 /DNA_START=70 /DNA_END=651 /DNA_ORIENTATION=+
MKISVLSLAAIIAVAQAAAVPQLTVENYRQMTYGKHIFVKAFAPWCEHCQAMEGEFKQLYEKYASSENLLIAEVDCTEEEALCEEMGVDGYPQVMYGDPDAHHNFEADRDFETMAAFIESEKLADAICSIKHKENCDATTRAAYESLEARSLEELKQMQEDVEKELIKKREEAAPKLEALQRQYEEIVNEHDTW